MSLSSDSRNNAASAVRLTKIGRFFIILVFLLSLMGGPAIGAKADSTISYIGAIGSGTQNVAATLTTTISLSSSTSITAGDAIIIAYTTDAAPDIPLTITNSWSSSDKYQVVKLFSHVSANSHLYLCCLQCQRSDSRKWEHHHHCREPAHQRNTTPKPGGGGGCVQRAGAGGGTRTEQQWPGEQYRCHRYHSQLRIYHNGSTSSTADRCGGNERR